jgi:membrane peptidoglycan carboxypeptidase
VTLLDMTGAYSVFANDGLRNPPTGILSVEDNRGNVLEQYEKNESRALDPQVARQISDILSDNVARTPLYGANSPLNFPGKDVAAKTGTTNDNKDAWVLGYSTSIVTGAWAGNNTPAPMNQISGLIVTPMWREFMDIALEKYPPDEFPAPSPDPERDNLPPVLRGEWNTNPSQGLHDILFWVNKDDPRNGQPNFNDSQLNNWDYAVSIWSQQTVGSSTSSGGNGFTITSPQAGSQVSSSEPFDASVSFDASLGFRSVTYYLNGQFVGVSALPPYVIAIQPRGSGAQTLRAVAETNNGEIQTQITFTAN